MNTSANAPPTTDQTGAAAPGIPSGGPSNPLGLSLKGLAMRGSVWTFAGYGASQLLRLASSLVLTRLLFPQAFGLMGLVNVVLSGLEMLSDLGVGPTIVFHPRGEDPRFLQTAWTIKVVRGFALWLVAVALAAPLAAFYREPLLLQMIPVAALSAVINGFSSTRMFTAKRSLALGRLTLLGLFGQAATVLATVGIAFQWRSVWALVIGGLVGPIVTLVLSHTYLHGIRNRFLWDRDSARILGEYGKWIYLSSILFFVAVQGDRLMVGRFLDMATLGIYMVAVNLTQPMVALNQQIWRQVMLPALSRVYREQPVRLAEVYYKTRFVTEALFSAGAGAFAMLGEIAVRTLYDPRYAAAGVIVQVMCIRAFLTSIAEGMETCLAAMRKQRNIALSHVGRTAWVLGGIPLGWHVDGLRGIALAAATSEIPVILLFVVVLARLRVLRWQSELRPWILGCAGVTAGFGLSALILWLLGAPGPA